MLTAYQQEPFQDAPERDAIEDGMLPWSQRRWRCRLGWHSPHAVDFQKRRPRCEHCGKFFQR